MQYDDWNERIEGEDGDDCDYRRTPSFSPRRTRADDEYMEALYLNAVFDCEKRAEKFRAGNEATMKSLITGGWLNGVCEDLRKRPMETE